MEIGVILDAMRDPAGIPSHPRVFQVLMVATWVLHIAFVQMTMGVAALSIVGFHRRDRHPHWHALSVAMTKAAKVGVSLLIVLGVAPLLFTQVIYDPQWYAASVLSARWLIVFIFTLIIGYCSWFVFYYANRPGADRRIGVFAWVGLGLFLLDGLVMHALSYQSLLPDRWMAWYAPGGVVDTSGAALHALQWPRYLFIIGLSAPASGVFLLAYTRYIGERGDRDPDYLAFVAGLGQRLAFVGSLISLGLLLWWQASHPASLGLTLHVLPALLGLGLIGIAWVHRPGKSPWFSPYGGVAAFLGVLGVLAVWREVIRIAHLQPFGYTIADYPMHVDWPSTLLFFSTLLGVGGLVGGFFVALLYKAGKTPGIYTADRTMARLGTAAVVVLAFWIAAFFGYGITIWMRNAFAL
jgi:hypothetical protein